MPVGIRSIGINGGGILYTGVKKTQKLLKGTSFFIGGGAVEELVTAVRGLPHVYAVVAGSVFVNIVLTNADTAEGRAKAIAEIEAKAKELTGM